MSIYTETTRTQALAGHEQARRIYAIRARNWSTASTWADRPEHPNTRVTRRAVDAASIGTFRPSSARAQFARGTDVLFGEQVDQHAALRVDLMRRGVAAPIGPRFSRAAAQHDRRARRFGSAFVREWNAGDVAAAFHAFAYPEAYAPRLEVDPRPYAASIVPRHPRIANRLSDVQVPDREPNGHGFTGADRDAWNLEAQADAILREAGEHVVRLDVRDARTHLMTVTPDRVAYRGTPVHTLPESASDARAIGTRSHRVRVRHHKNGTRTAASWRLVTSADALPRARRAPLHASTVDLDAAWADALIGRTMWAQVTELETIQLRGARRTYSIIGRRPAVRLEDRVERRTRKRREARADTPVKRGRPAAHPLALSDRTLRRRWAAATPDQIAAADLLVTILTTTTPDTVLRTTADVTVTVIDGAIVRLNDGAAEPYATAARRLALLALATVAD